MELQTDLLESHEMTISPIGQAPRTPISYWFIGALLVVYVALCTGNRDRHPEADAWEHHRVVSALTQNLWEPGNPTYASPTPSIRYSPYFLTLATVCRFTGLDPYDALSLAAIGNTILLVIGLWLLLKRFGKSETASAALIILVSLYGGAPAYANSYALSDLPWHQVNPSAFSFALTLIVWSLLGRDASGRVRWPAATLLATIAMLDHPMTGAFCLLGLFVLGATDESNRGKRLAGAIGVSAVVAGLSLLWPWYSFRTALTWSGDQEFWFNPAILRRQMTEWCVPAMLALVFALPWRREPLVRACLAGTALMLALTVAAFAIKSPTLARLFLPGMLFLHLPIAVYAHDMRLFRPWSWPSRLRMTWNGNRETQPAAGAQVVVMAGLLYCLIPQLVDIAKKPYLARPYLERLMNRPEKQPSPRAPLARILSVVRPGDVVLSDPITSWQVPSVCPGRIVAALHYELFVPEQAQRMRDLARFFSAATSDADRRAILTQYGVKWILLNRDQIGEQVFLNCQREKATIAAEGAYILMDAALWKSESN